MSKRVPAQTVVETVDRQTTRETQCELGLYPGGRKGLADRFVVAHSAEGGTGVRASGGTDTLVLDWTSARRNAICDPSMLLSACEAELPPLLQDLLDVATAVYLADVAAFRGTHEEWVRRLHLRLPVLEPTFWQAQAGDLQHLLYSLTRDSFSFHFVQADRPSLTHSTRDACVPGRPDCICLLSGGLDSFAGAVSLLRAGRKPFFVSHQSANPVVETAQRKILSTLETQWPGQTRWAGVRVTPGSYSPGSIPFPSPEKREPSRRARPVLFLTLGAIASHCLQTPEVYLCENGVLTAALPLTPARIGGMSTRSTHPMTIKLFSELLQKAGVCTSYLNPFMFQTKGEVLRTFLRPVLSPREIAQSVSCWMAGRFVRPCGGCVPCLLRRIALLSAGLPDEACINDVLRRPEEYRGTDAFGNLVDLLTQASTFLGRTDLELLLDYPQFADLVAAEVPVQDVLRTMKRHAAEVLSVCDDHFPAAASMMHDAVH